MKKNMSHAEIYHVSFEMWEKTAHKFGCSQVLVEIIKADVMSTLCWRY